MQPMDGMQFVTQLAQFSQFESTYGIQNDTDTLVADVEYRLQLDQHGEFAWIDQIDAPTTGS